MKVILLFMMMMLMSLCGGANIREKRADSESATDSSGRCLTTKTWKDDCNTCFCTEGSFAACTLIGCIHLEGGANVREKREGSELPTTDKCVPGTRWKKDCNTCWCTESGLAPCTRIGCSG